MNSPLEYFVVIQLEDTSGPCICFIRSHFYRIPRRIDYLKPVLILCVLLKCAKPDAIALSSCQIFKASAYSLVLLKFAQSMMQKLLGLDILLFALSYLDDVINVLMIGSYI